MNQLGFRESTRSGLSFATDDLVTPETKAGIVAEAEKEVIKFRKHYERGVITEQERYHKVLDTWTHAREKITKDMMAAMEADDRGGTGYVNPVFLDGSLRCPRWCRADSTVGRDARFDGQADRRNHRNADQSQLPRRFIGS